MSTAYVWGFLARLREIDAIKSELVRSIQGKLHDEKMDPKKQRQDVIEILEELRTQIQKIDANSSV